MLFESAVAALRDPSPVYAREIGQGKQRGAAVVGEAYQVRFDAKRMMLTSDAPPGAGPILTWKLRDRMARLT